MGWSSGTEVCERIWEYVRTIVPEEKRLSGLVCVIRALQDQDWDCEYEIEDLWPESKKALKKCLPDYGEEE